MNTLAASSGSTVARILRSLDTRRQQDGFVGGVALEREDSRAPGRRQSACRSAPDTTKATPAGRQVLGQHNADPAETADDDVLVELLDIVFHAVRAQQLLDLRCGQRLHQNTLVTMIMPVQPNTMVAMVTRV